MSSHNESYFIRKAKQIYRKYREKSKDEFMKAQTRWFDDLGDHTLRIDYDLDKDSVVFDVGGYVGAWSHKIVSMYNPNIYIFEPVKKFYEVIVKNFENNSKVKVSAFGLSNEERQLQISIKGQGSSIYFKGEKEEAVLLKDIVKFIKDNSIEKITLIKINCEGEEYNILNRLIKTGLIKRCKNIQICFHIISKNSIQEREKIREELKKTHDLIYDYYFVCESWKSKVGGKE